MATTALQVFAYDENMIRTVEGENGEVYFVAKDIAGMLGYANPQEAIRTHCKKAISVGDIRGVSDSLTPTKDPFEFAMGKTRLDPQTKLIPEPDVWRLIIRSNMPEAEKIEKWIVEEVLPTIRKTGGYGVTAEARELALRVAKLEKEAAKAKQIAKKPKPDSVESFISKKIICTSGYSSFTRGVHSKYMDFCRFHRLNPDMRRLQQRLLEVSKGLSEDGFWYMGISIKGERR